jgi:hypothetical protein
MMLFKAGEVINPSPSIRRGFPNRSHRLVIALVPKLPACRRAGVWERSVSEALLR